MNTVDEILRDFKQGKPVVITDDERRENEGDIIFAAQKATPELINFMMKEARGLICVPMSREKIDRLALRQMVLDNRDRFRTAFTVSVDAAEGTTTGISAQDRSRTIRLLAEPSSTSKTFAQPGHVFPIEARDGGVLVRAGHTEAAVDLCAMSGLEPVGVICEIIKDDGSMARTEDLKAFCEKHKLSMGTIADIIEYRRRTEVLIERVAETVIPTPFGTFTLCIYKSLLDGIEHVALVRGEDLSGKNVPVRVHSECLTGDVFHSFRCDCGEQLAMALDYINTAGRGVVVYLRQEGRGIGLGNKIKAYHLQDKGLDTVEANEKLGFAPDLREYGIGAQILVDLGVKSIELLTNNPRKIIGLKGFGLNISTIKNIKVKPNKHNEKYLKTKRDKLGHLF